MTRFLEGKTFTINVQGCRTNQYEGEAIAAALEKNGAARTSGSADIAVTVTCTVTAVADRKCRKTIRRLRRENPMAVTVACGCYAQKLSETDREALGIDILVGSRLKHMIPALIAQWFADPAHAHISALEDNILTDHRWDSLALDRPRLHTRAFLKVQDGCSHFCSYCIVPFVRGRPVSRDMDEAVAEAGAIVASGCPEIVLTGVHLGLYSDLPGLVRRIGAIDGLKRLRFGSIEPFAVNAELLAALAETPAFCRHLHIPLQSGDDGVLAAMRRGYTSDEFMKIADNARRVLGDDVHISTDLMVGFPGEDERAFHNSLDLIRKVGMGKIHVFPYSPREGTDAAEWKRPAPEAVRERENEALSAAAELHRKYCSRWIGRKVEILVEEARNGVVRGLTQHYVHVAARRVGAKVDDFKEVTPDSYADGILTSGCSVSCRDENSERCEFL